MSYTLLSDAAVAVIVTFPYLSAFTLPFWFTVAIVSSLLVQITFLFSASEGSTVTVS